MSKRTLIINDGDMFGVWKVLEANVINPNTKNKAYINKNVYSKCLCTNCNETIRYILNYELQKYSEKKCLKCTNHEKAKPFQPKIGERFGMLEIIGDGGYTDERHYSICKCDCGNVVRKKDNNLKSGFTISCGCQKSKGELNIETILKQHNITYSNDVVLESFYKDTNRKLRFDFVIYNENGSINRIIEFDGRQHIFGPDTTFWNRKYESLEIIQERDKLKNNWCIKNNYILIRIPYTKVNNITFEDLFSNKFQVKEGEEK